MNSGVSFSLTRSGLARHELPLGSCRWVACVVLEADYTGDRAPRRRMAQRSLLSVLFALETEAARTGGKPEPSYHVGTELLMA